MSRSKGVPGYRLHRQSGQAVVTLTDPSGRRRDFLLGKYGSKESRAEYSRLLLEWETSGRTLYAWNGPPLDLTVTELIEKYWGYVEVYYRHADGSPTGEQNEMKRSLCPLKYLHGKVLASEYGPMRLKAVRQLMIAGYDHPDFGPQEKLSRGVINQRISRIKALFKWAVENELVPPSIHHGLLAVKGLCRGRTEARETEPVKPVPIAFVEATIASASPTVGDMIQLQLLTGIRPGELVIMRAIDLDMRGPIWFYTPEKHKTAYLGYIREIAIGPKAQDIIRRYLQPNLEAFLFSPRKATEERHKQMRAKRKSKVQPSQICRKKKKPRTSPGDHYDRVAYSRAVTYAAKKAGVPHWHPHQLRHNRATDIRKKFGIDAARAVLGHRSTAMTEVYAELDLGQAAEVMAKIG